MFITFEGGEGAGKSTQLRLLAEALTARGIPLVATREPGGSPGAERIRELIVSGEAQRWDAVTETLLLMAARADHVARTIRPALAQGQWVLCDRFFDSTRIYQGVAKGLDAHWLEQLYALLFANLAPDLTFYLDIDPAEGLKRASARRGGETRFESLPLAFHEALRRGFLDLAAREPGRVVTLDASASVEAVHRQVLNTLEAAR